MVETFNPQPPIVENVPDRETVDREPLFDDEEDVSYDLIPMRLPVQMPTKHDMKMYRAQLVERLTGELGALRALILVKLIEKIVADKEEGVIEQIKGTALEEFQRDFPGTKSAEINGVSVSVARKTWWEYPQDVNELEVEVAEMTRKLKAAKKAAEIEGRAHKMTNDFGTIRVSF